MTGGYGAIPSARAHDLSVWEGTAEIRGPQCLRLPILTVGLLGVQTFWSLEMAYASPYLLSLGLSKSSMAMVFLAGPISGLIVQPLIGALADSSRSKFGRRRPYMIIGVAMSIAGMLLLGFAREVASRFTAANAASIDNCAIHLAILAIFIIDMAINAVQAVDRALIVDSLDLTEQVEGNSWAARMLGIGSVFGFFIGNIDLVPHLPMLGNTELQILAVLGSMLLITTHAIVAFAVREKVLVSSEKSNSLKDELSGIWSSMFTLPKVILQICMIQFFAWIGWFPVLFYSTAYVVELVKQPYGSLPISGPERSHLEEEGTRRGSTALLWSSILAILANFALPLIVQGATQDPISKRKTIFDKYKCHLATLWAASHLLFAICLEGTWFVTSVRGNMLLIALTGVSWAMTQWAPFSLLGEAILSEDTPPIRSAEGVSDDDVHGTSLSNKSGSILGVHNVFIVLPQFLSTGFSSIVFALVDRSAKSSGNPPKSHALSLSMLSPAFRTTIQDTTTTVNPYAIIFRVGGISTLVAGFLAYRLSRSLQQQSQQTLPQSHMHPAPPLGVPVASTSAGERSLLL